MKTKKKKKKKKKKLLCLRKGDTAEDPWAGFEAD